MSSAILVPSIEISLTLARNGDTRGALAAAQAACEQAGASFELMSLMGDLHAALMDSPSAALCYRRAAAMSPLDAGAQRRLAGVELSLGNAAAAAEGFRRALQLDPGNARAHNNLGRALQQLGGAAAAARSFRQALAIEPGYAIAHANLGHLLADGGDPQSALMCYRHALELDGDIPGVWLGCAKVLLRLAQPLEALSACDRAAAVQVPSAALWLARGEVLDALERSNEALQCCDQALLLEPEYAQAHYARGKLLRGMGERSAALEAFRSASESAANYDAARFASAVAEVPALPWDALEAAHGRDAFGAALDKLSAHFQGHPSADATCCVGAIQPFYLAYQEDDQRPLLMQHGSLCAELMGKWQRDMAIPRATRRKTGKVRVAIVSAHIAQHSVYRAITRGWLERLDRDRFVLQVFHLGSGNDSATEEARAMADHFTGGLGFTIHWTRAILDQQPDIVLYPELGMNQTALQLAAMRLAKTQLVAWGHPITSGLPTMDYFVSAEAFEPECASSHYSERLLSLPNLGVYCSPRQWTAAEIATAQTPRPEPLFICAGTPFKYAPIHDALFTGIARRLHHCRFMFFSYGDGALSRRLMKRLGESFMTAGLDPDAHLVMQPWAGPAQFEQLLRSADVFLDTVGFSGFNTVLQALQCGLPVVTHRGRFLRGRLGSGILDLLSVPELVASSVPAMVDIASALALDHRQRREIMARVQASLPSLYCDQSCIERFQDFLIALD